SFSWPRWGRLAGQKQKRRLKKGFNHAGGCRHTFCGNATGLYGSLSAVFKVLEAASAASKQARCLRFNQGKLQFSDLAKAHGVHALSI
ncbi:hypothetical protein ABU952_19445, partial [Bacillus amyloliquefaciens]|uniref:hypothetical protein n=1 Tax=Bacillus amyloliquefaciens TaxID=1390 RepID=UPI00336B74B3